MKVGQPTRRTDNPAGRSVTMLTETLLHTRMLQWRIVGLAHWFVFVGFGLLFFTLLTAFGQLFDAHFTLPLIGTFFLYEWISELFTVVMLIAIIGFIAYRATRPRSARAASRAALGVPDVAGVLRRVRDPGRGAPARGAARP